MQIQQGVVRYKDRTDLICNYGITEDGKQYYFLDNKPLPNGNIIATSLLVEAVDPSVKAAHAGVITRDGKVVIPLENKTVKNLGNNVLLVERAVPISKNVLESIGLKNIPDAATKLVTTPATIKDRLMIKMENEGRFVFNDQFSEASIFDYDGKNLIDNEYFSFIGMNSKKIYFSKNTVDSEITEYSLFPEKVALKDEGKDAIKVEEVAKDNKETIENAINEQVALKETANNAANSSVLVGKHTAPVSVPVPPAPVEPALIEVKVPPVAPSVEAPQEKVEVVTPIAPPVVPEPPAPVAPEVAPVEVAEPVAIEPVKQEEPQKEEEAKLEIKAQNEEVKEVEENKKVEEIPQEEVEDKTIEIPIVEEEEKPEDTPSIPEEVSGKLLDADEVAKVVLENEEEKKPEESVEPEEAPKEEEIEITFPTEEVEEQEEDVHQEENDLEDYEEDFSDRDLFGDSLLNLDRIDLDYDEDRLSNDMNIIDDVTKSMSNLISLNKKQNSKILDYEKSIARLRRNGSDLNKKSKKLEDEIRFLNNKVRNYETIVSKLESRNRELDDRIQEQNKKIKEQEEEIVSLRPSATSKEELLKLIADANSLIDDEDIEFRRNV